MDDKVLNTDIKRLLPLVGSESRERFIERWLGFELELNELGLAYRDELDSVSGRVISFSNRARLEGRETARHRHAR